MLMTSLHHAAKALGGEVSRGSILCPGPGHSRRDRSLSIRFDHRAPDGFVVTSFSGDDWQSCRDHVRARLGLPEWQPGDEQNRTVQESKAFDRAWADAEAKNHRRREDDVERIGRAQHIWNDAGNPRDTVAEHYLESRALVLTNDVAGTVLRFHPRCPWRTENTGRTEHIPAIVAAFRSITDDAVTGIHRIRLDQPERWPKAERRMLGLVHGAAVKLAPLAGRSLAIGEGIETCMAAKRYGYSPAWALGSAGQISTFPLLQARELLILGEHDDANRNAASICGARYHRAGRQVKIVRSKIGKDINDQLLGEAI